MILTIQWKTALFVTLASAVAGQACGPTGGKVAIAGSSTVFPLADAWAVGYRARCPGVDVTVEEGGSGRGATRVCAAGGFNPVDIGAMSRKFNPPTATSAGEANVTDAASAQFICNIGDKTRKIQQIEVGLDGLTMVLASSGLAAQCLRKTPGLTIAQLRWMYSNYSEVQQGLDTPDKVKAVIPNSDGNTTSRNWSELEVTCPVTNIRIAGPDSTSGPFQFFQEVVFPLRTQGESFETRREGGYFNSILVETVRNYVETSRPEVYGDAIAYFGFSYYLEKGALLYGVPIQNVNTKAYVAPVRANLLDDSYVPFSRRLYMQLLNNNASLANTKPYIAYGLSNTGTQLGDQASIVTLPLDQRTAQLARLGLPAPNDQDPVAAPTSMMTRRPTRAPTKAPTKVPTNRPTRAPTKAPTKVPTKRPTRAPTSRPTKAPTRPPSRAPITPPTRAPTTSKECGFRLLCLLKCGPLRRIFGLCRN
jgi:ABC-type phosphate transport system substrate-binding protein